MDFIPLFLLAIGFIGFGHILSDIAGPLLSQGRGRVTSLDSILILAVILAILLRIGGAFMFLIVAVNFVIAGV